MRWFSAGLHPMGDLSLWSTCTFSAQRQHEMIQTEMDMAVSPPQLVANECKYSTRVCNIRSNVQTECKKPHDSPRLCFLHLAESCAAVRQIAVWHYHYSEGWKCTEQGKQASHYNRHLATNTSITAAEQGWRCARTHLQRAAIQDNEIQYAKSLEFQQEEERSNGTKTTTLPLSPTEESRAIGTVYILQERVSSSEDVLWFFLQACWDDGRPLFHHHFYYRHERDITSTEMVCCSSHWFHCISVINGDLNTLASYS